LGWTPYYRGPPQIIKLDVECTGEPKVKISPDLTKETVLYKGKQHVQFNSMYVCTLKVAGERHGITAQAQRGGIVDFGSQNSASIDRGGRGGDGGNNNRGWWRRVRTRRRRRTRTSRKYSNSHRLFQQHNNILANIIRATLHFFVEFMICVPVKNYK
jgi:hypothetical protein